MQTSLTRRLTGVVIGSLFALTLAAPLFADDQPLTVQGNQPIRETLQQKTGARVTLQLLGGQELSGKLAEVGETAVHLSELTGKEFYDAVIRLDHISAIVLRMRDK